MAHFSVPHRARVGCAPDASVSRPSTHATLSCNHPPALTVADGRDDPLAELFLGVTRVSPTSLTAVWSMRGCAGSHASACGLITARRPGIRGVPMPFLADLTVADSVTPCGHGAENLASREQPFLGLLREHEIIEDDYRA
eukprot:COSAG06_NODE_654_length_13350_cov_72.384499_9_plen_140_part_00